MESFVFDDVLAFSDNSYLLKTQNSEAQKLIISSVFRSGVLLYSRNVAYNGQLSEEQLFEKVEGYHQGAKGDVESLFKFSKKYANSVDYGMRILLIRAFFKNKMFDEAGREIKRFLKINPNSPTLYFYLGDIYMKLNKYEEAVKYLTKATELEDKYADYFFSLGVAHLRLDQCKDAIRAFIRAAKINNYYSDAYFFLGVAYLKNAIVKEDFELAKDVKPTAKQCFEKALHLRPDFKNTLFIEGQEALEAGNINKAYEKLEQITRAPIAENRHEFVLDFYIKYLGAESGVSVADVEEYIERLKSMTRKFSNYADLQYELGVAYMILGKCIAGKAGNSFERALSINQNYSDAKRMLVKIKEQNDGFI